MATISGPHHVAFTVRDVESSTTWYSDLLGMQVLLERDDDAGKVRVLAHPDTGWILGLREHAGADRDEFTEFRTGLDHFAFAVSSRAEMDSWESELKSRGITFTPVTETPIGTVIAFRDPDNIQLEFWLPIDA